MEQPLNHGNIFLQKLLKVFAPSKLYSEEGELKYKKNRDNSVMSLIFIKNTSLRVSIKILLFHRYSQYIIE